LFDRLGRFIFEVGKLVAKACENFGTSPSRLIPHRHLLIRDEKEADPAIRHACYMTVSSQASSVTTSVADMIGNSQCNKARLLHYFPPVEAEKGQDGSEGVDDDACGMHLDHSILTGLCKCDRAGSLQRGVSLRGFVYIVI